MKFSVPLLLSAAAVSVSALPAVTRTGKFLYSEDGTRFLVKGIAYQEAGTVGAQTEESLANGGFPEPDSFHDPLADSAACERDLPNLQKLGINVIRSYSVNASLNHDACMKLFEDAGIYTIIDLALPLNGSINRASPAWTTDLLGLYTTTIDSFSKYNNVLAFNIGNEVINLPANTNVAPFVKAAARDTKAYLKSKSSNALVSYTSGDGPSSWLTPLADYLACDSDANAIDMFGLNNYQWCGDADVSVWQDKLDDFKDLAVPLYLSEFGCVKSGPRKWTEVPALFSSPVSDQWSGGIAFSYYATLDNFGMTTLSADNKTITVSAEFNALVTQMSNVTLPTTPAKSSVSSVASPPCPSTTTDWTASTKLPSTPDLSVCQCLENTAFACTRTSAIASQPILIGDQINLGCSTLGSDGGTATCDAIAANGATGTYGAISFCSADVKLSYIYSAHYVFSKYNAQACDFAGNATVNANAPKSSGDADSASKACLEKRSADTFTPSAVPAATSPAGGSTDPSASAAVPSSSTGASGSTGGASSRVGGGGVAFALGSVAFAVAAFL